MKVIPTSRQAWGAFVLFPFKAYSLIALVVFLSVCSRFDKPGSVDSIFGIWIIVGYIVSALVLLLGGLIEMIFLKSKSGVWSLVFGVADVIMMDHAARFQPRGGPGPATYVASYFSFRNFFEISNVGYGATIATILTIIIVLITVIYLKVQTQQEREEGLYG